MNKSLFFTTAAVYEMSKDIIGIYEITLKILFLISSKRRGCLTSLFALGQVQEFETIILYYY